MTLKQLNTQMRTAFHNTGVKGSGIIFDVLDTGVKPISYLSGKVTAKTSDGFTDKKGHGTFVAGQLIEWCPDARINSWRVLPKDEYNDASLIIKSLQDLLPIVLADKEHQHIVNMSLSGSYYTKDPELVEYLAAITALVDAGVPVIVAAGNDGEERCDKFPSYFWPPITVSAIDENFKKANFTTFHDHVDFCDDGVRVYGLSITSGNGYTFKDGTSMSAPNLAGKAGLVMCAYMQKNKKRMSETLLYETLKAMANDLGSSLFDGYGWVDITKVVSVEEPKKEEIEVPEEQIKISKFPYLAEYAGSTRVNVRTGAGTSFNKIGLLSSGEECIVIDEQNGWTEIVKHEDDPIIRGFCVKTYLKEI